MSVKYDWSKDGMLDKIHECLVYLRFTLAQEDRPDHMRILQFVHSVLAILESSLPQENEE